MLVTQKNLLALGLLMTILLCWNPHSEACSMYKITLGGKTMVGCNEDAWRSTPRIWFENASEDQKYGAAFTGSRKVGKHHFAPQSGMNEAGLVFSRLASYHPKLEQSKVYEQQPIKNRLHYLKNILHQCKTVAEVKAYISQYNHSVFIEDVFIYIDQSGDYLVVEPYQLISGNDSKYVLSNFCPSITSNQQARKLTRFRNGENLLNSRVDTTLNFCKTVSDTMHVCRPHKGDGTLLTSIWDTKAGITHLYFYHNYEEHIQFNLKDELAKGNHILEIPSLFSNNEEFNALTTYITPFNTPVLRVSLVFIGGFFFASVIFLGAQYFRKRKMISISPLYFLFIFLGIFMTYYMYVLATHINLFYFEAPYQDYYSKLVSLSSYIPILALASLFPIIRYTVHSFKNTHWGWLTRGILSMNTLMYIVALFGFWYWGLLVI